MTVKGHRGAHRWQSAACRTSATSIDEATVELLCGLTRYKKGDVSVLNEFMPGGGTTPGRTPGGSTPPPAAAGTRAQFSRFSTVESVLRDELLSTQASATRAGSTSMSRFVKCLCCVRLTLIYMSPSSSGCGACSASCRDCSGAKRLPPGAHPHHPHMPLNINQAPLQSECLYGKCRCAISSGVCPKH